MSQYVHKRKSNLTSLAYIFKSCMDAEIFSNEWKIAKVTPLFKKGSKRELWNYGTIDQYQYCHSSQKFLKKIFIINFMIIFRKRLEKAFDTIDHEIILRKLANYEVDPNALRFFASYLCNRSQKCTVNGALSSASKLTCEVLQGSILGPLFFLIYINDLPNCLDISCAKMFADDTNITVP